MDPFKALGSSILLTHVGQANEDVTKYLQQIKGILLGDGGTLRYSSFSIFITN